MSSYRKVRSSHSIYHPGISLSHEPTYNQKKGMILTRSTNLPQPVHKVVTAQSLRDDARQAVKSGYVNFKKVTLNFPVEHVDNEYHIDEENIRQFLTEKLGPGINIVAADVTYFALNTNGFVSPFVWPDINYTISIDDASVAVTTNHSSSSSGFGGLMSASFGTPVYVTRVSPIVYSLFCPRFETYPNSTFGYARVVESAPTLSASMKTNLDTLHSAGFTEIPYCSFGGIYPYSISTVLTFDASTVPETVSIMLQLSCDVYYIK